MVLVVALGASGLAACRTPRTVCEDYVTAIRRMFDRCAPGWTFDIRWTDGVVGCENVQSVSDPGIIYNQCIPWADQVSCADINPTDPGSSLDPSCSAGVFRRTR